VSTIWRVCDAFDLSYPKAAALVHGTLADVTKTVSGIERSEFLAQQMTRLEALAAKAQEEGQLSVALGAYRELHALARLTA
jgi:hypothetical protein